MYPRALSLGDGQHHSVGVQGDKVHPCEESQPDTSKAVLVWRCTGVTGSRGKRVRARHHPEAQERVTSPDYLNCERVTQLFLQSFEFQQNIFSAMLTAFPPTYCICGFVPPRYFRITKPSVNF